MSDTKAAPRIPALPDFVKYSWDWRQFELLFDQKKEEEQVLCGDGGVPTKIPVDKVPLVLEALFKQLPNTDEIFLSTPEITLSKAGERIGIFLWGMERERGIMCVRIHFSHRLYLDLRLQTSLVAWMRVRDQLTEAAQKTAKLIPGFTEDAREVEVSTPPAPKPYTDKKARVEEYPIWISTQGLKDRLLAPGHHATVLLHFLLDAQKGAKNYGMNTRRRKLVETLLREVHPKLFPSQKEASAEVEAALTCFPPLLYPRNDGRYPEGTLALSRHSEAVVQKTLETHQITLEETS